VVGSGKRKVYKQDCLNYIVVGMRGRNRMGERGFSLATAAALFIVTLMVAATGASAAFLAPGNPVARGTVSTANVGGGWITVVGAAFGIPKSIENDISSQIDNYGGTGFILVSGENIYLVVADCSDKGIATVDGWLLDDPIEIAGVRLGVILADTVSFDKEGEPATVGEILADPDSYHMRLVRVEATRRQVSILIDLGAVDNYIDNYDIPPLRVPVTCGYLVENPGESIVFDNEDVVGLAQNPSRSLVRDLLQADGEQRLCVFDFEHDYWYDAPAVTNGIVISPGAIIAFFENILGSDLVQLDNLAPVLYDVETRFVWERASVVEINQNADYYNGRVIRISAEMAGARISVKRLIEQAAASAGIPVTIPVDIRVEGAVAWNDVSSPPRLDEFIGVIGASSYPTDLAVEPVFGSFDYLARVFSLDGLPPVLILCGVGSEPSSPGSNEPFVRIELPAGWSMLSTPLTLPDPDPDSVFHGYYALYGWNADSQSYRLVGGSMVDRDEPLEPGRGYWVFLTEPDNVEFVGVPEYDMALGVSEGWNLVGAPWLGASVEYPDDTPDGSVLPYAFGWSGGYAVTTELSPGAGYWLYAVRDCELRLLPSNLFTLA